MIKIKLGFLSFIFSGLVFGASEQIPIDRSIISISAYDHMVFIKFSPLYRNSQNCTSGNTNTIVLDTADELGENIYSAALAAAAANKTVGFGINGCLSERPKAYRIDVQF